MTTRSDRGGDFFDNVKRGIALGLIFAALYSLYVIVLFAVAGSEPFDKHHTSVLTVVASYFAGGISAGAIVGALRPYAVSRFGASLIGIVASFFVFFGIALASKGFPSHWTEPVWEAIVVLSVFFGVVSANIFWNNPID